MNQPHQLLESNAHNPEASRPAGAGPSVAADDTRPILADAMIIVPVRNMVLFPGMMTPIAIGRKSSIAAAQQAVKSERPIGILLQSDPHADTPTPADLTTMGTMTAILRYVTTPDGEHHIICQGQQRFRVLGYLDGFPFIVATVERIDAPSVAGNTEIEAGFIQLKERAVEVLQLLPQVPQEMVHAVQNIDAPGTLADLVAGSVDIKPAEKQTLLEEVDLQQRMDRLLDMLAHRIEVMQISRDIDKRTKASVGRREREFLLREQLKAIQSELGEGAGDNAAEIEDLRQQIAEAGMPDDVATQATKELKRLERMSDASAEYSMLRTYLDWLVEIPWKAPEPDTIDVAQARRVLDVTSAWTRSKPAFSNFWRYANSNPVDRVPCSVWWPPPESARPRWGSRSPGHWVASLSACRWVACMTKLKSAGIDAPTWGLALKKAGTRGCVMMLDEIDKLGAGARGDPSAALLEVLDPEQNNTFRDNYLAVPYDLSQMLFIATANVLDPVPGPLRDRMKVLQLSSYTREEKLAIARKYLVARQLDACGLKTEQLEFTDATLAGIIRDYTREAGVRGLERQIGVACRRAAMRIAEGETQTVRVDAHDLAEMLGSPKFEDEVALRAGMPGVATALASLFMDRPVRVDAAMTGEISLRGLVLPIGGIKEKVLAAAAAGIKRVLLPARNRKDLDELPLSARQQLEFIFLDDMDQAVSEAIAQRASTFELNL